MRIFVLGAGVQRTLYAVRPARAGHEVTLVARHGRAAELLQYGAAIEESVTGQADTMRLSVIEHLDPQTVCDICLITVRREHLTSVLSDLSNATGIGQFVFMVNHANGSEEIYQALDRSRVVLAFPGAAGSLEKVVVHYVNVRKQRTAVEARALNIAALFGQAGVRVQRVQDMNGWLQRHAVHYSYCRVRCTPNVEIPDGWREPERYTHANNGRARGLVGTRSKGRRVSPPFALRAIFCWVPLWFAVGY